MLAASDVKKKTLSEGVLALSDDALESAIGIACAIVDSFNLNRGADDFDRIYDAACLMTLEWYVSNPAFRAAFSQDKFQETFQKVLPFPILAVIRPLLSGSAFARLEREGGA